MINPNDRVKGLIGQKASAFDLREEAIKLGMKTLRLAGLEKVRAGETSLLELLRVTEEI